MACKDCSNAVLEEAQQIVEQVGSEPEKVIPLLQEIQNRHSYLPDDLVEAVADVIEVPSSDIYGVATFYSQFRFTPMGKHLIKVCKGTACHVSGADLLTASISDELG
ncbi:MAG: NAD(P)H-dependent oxidoreductase subunit E, partial [Spirochaetia bacterium]|nr:NAD(P)H-dependent oxidoreductase subunit E [Spirochaetia bacterium]